MSDFSKSIPLYERKILITGASRGIGAAIARGLLDAGAGVVGIGRDFSDWQNTPEHFQAEYVDLANLDRLPDRLKALAAAHPELDGVICNAGSGRFGALEQFSATQIGALVDLNLTQHLLVARTFVPLLKRRGFGDLIFMGSEAALTGGRKGTVYSACKFALRGAAQSLRLECAAAGVIETVEPDTVV